MAKTSVVDFFHHAERTGGSSNDRQIARFQIIV